MQIFHISLLGFALISFVLGAFRVQAAVDWMLLGFAFVTASFIFG